MSRDIMIDIETWGVRPGCAIRSIAAVEFTLDGNLVSATLWNVEEGSCKAAGLHFDPDTVGYWSRQPEAVQKALVADQGPLNAALVGLSTALGGVRPTLWAYGSEFDFPILTAAYEACGIETPWKAPQLRDSRTILETFGFDVRTMAPPKEPRTAATRALFQAQCLVTCLHGRI